METVQKAAEIERFKLGESGYLGLNVFNGVSKDEIKKELNFPDSLKTFKQMSYHSTINAALTLYESLISKATWVVRLPQGATEEEKQRAEFIRSCMDDMEHSWKEFVKDALSMNIFGFSIHEKVYRRRLKSNGSKFNDGLIGWKKLPIRNQETISKFLFSEDGNEIAGVKQDVALVEDPYSRYTNRKSTEVLLPKSKILLFRAGRHRGDPYGKSPLRDAYLAWRYLAVIEEIESNGVAKDISGLPVLYLPPQYLSTDAPPEQQAIRKYYEKALALLQQNQQSAMMLPQAFDPETRQPLFKLDLLSMEGKKSFDTTKIKEYYKNLILTSLFADILIMGQSSTGSFALGQVKNSLTGTAVESLVQGIKDVINKDLVKQTYELNGWDTSRMVEIDYDNLEDTDLETFSKAIQRVGSVGFLTKDLDVVNRIRESVGVDSLPEDSDWEGLLSENESRASDGMKTPGEGTSTSPGGSDNSVSNLENS